MRVIAFLFVAVMVATVSARSREGQAHATKVINPEKASPESIAAGQQVFQKYCGFCHGADAKGDGPMAPHGTHPPNLTDGVWLYGSGDVEIFTSIKTGIGPKFDMKPYENKISDQDIWNVVNYVRSKNSAASAAPRRSNIE